MEVEAAKMIGAGIACIALAGAGLVLEIFLVAIYLQQ